LIAHGTVDRLDELPDFLAKIRRGHPAPEELVREVRRRYEAIGGASPLKAICLELAKKLEASLGLPVEVAMRLWRPFPREVLEGLVARGVRRVVVVPLAQYSTKVYGDAVREAAQGLPLEIDCAADWGSEPKLVSAFAASIREARASAPEAPVVFTAHSLPASVIAAGDAYERVFRESVARVVEALGGVPHRVAFQSQGMGTGPGGRPIEWLGPDLRSTLEALAREGQKSAVVAPVGFLADHVEILYDLDIEAAGWAKELGLALHRARSLNAEAPLVEAVAAVARPLLERA
jgi:ferrochelatase